MRSAKDEILSFLKALAGRPDQVRVKQIDGDPLVFEIRACKADLEHFATKVSSINSVASSTGLKERRFVIKLHFEDEC
jgi:predicted RNA-binding protein YlqC (UPF0109 family)